MARTALLSGFAALALMAGTAAAQDAGGFAVDPRVGATVGMSMGMGMGMPPLMPRQPVFANAAPRGAPPGATVTNPNVSRSSLSQQAITKIRGDAGLLGGFSKGQALAGSRQAPVEPVTPNFNFIDAPFIVNNFDSSLSLTFGDGNVSSQSFQQGVPLAGDLPPDAGATASPGTTPTAAPTPAPAPKPAAKASGGNPGNPDKFFGGGFGNDFFGKGGRAPAGGAAGGAGAGIDPITSNFGPLPHLPAALANGGVQVNNVNSAFNGAIGQGNVTKQQVITVQKQGRR